MTPAGPSRTTSINGGTNADWFVTQGGDGFQTQVDPEDSNIVYAEAQYGNLVRFDRKNGEQIAIQPLPGKECQSVKARCAGQIGSLVELLQGKLSKSVGSSSGDSFSLASTRSWGTAA